MKYFVILFPHPADFKGSVLTPGKDSRKDNSKDQELSSFHHEVKEKSFHIMVFKF